MAPPHGSGSWRVAVTRDEPDDGPLGRALASHGLTPVPCSVLVERPPSDLAALEDAASTLETYDWVVVASARAVRAITHARGGPWPADIHTAAVGAATAAALASAGVTRPTVIAREEGAEALITLLEEVDWVDRRVLVPTTPGGRKLLSEHLRAAWALVDEVDAYVMEPRKPSEIAEDWQAAAPLAAVIASPRVAEHLTSAIGADALRALRVIVAIGPTTQLALDQLGIPCVAPPHSSFAEAARLIATARDREAAQ